LLPNLKWPDFSQATDIYSYPKQEPLLSFFLSVEIDIEQSWENAMVLTKNLPPKPGNCSQSHKQNKTSPDTTETELGSNGKEEC
jgi:hypothetical protein